MNPEASRIRFRPQRHPLRRSSPRGARVRRRLPPQGHGEPHRRPCGRRVAELQLQGLSGTVWEFAREALDTDIGSDRRQGRRGAIERTSKKSDRQECTVRPRECTVRHIFLEAAIFLLTYNRAMQRGEIPRCGRHFKY